MYVESGKSPVTVITILYWEGLSCLNFVAMLSFENTTVMGSLNTEIMIHDTFSYFVVCDVWMDGKRDGHWTVLCIA